MKTYTVMNHKSAKANKARIDKLNEGRSAKYQRLLQEGAKTTIPLETQLNRFKSTLKK